jgi:hypothetical protein
MVITCGAEHPKVILKLWPIGVVLHTRGPMVKHSRKIWCRLAGYLTRCPWVFAGETGGVVDQSKQAVLCILPRFEWGLVRPKSLVKATHTPWLTAYGPWASHRKLSSPDHPQSGSLVLMWIPCRPLQGK